MSPIERGIAVLLLIALVFVAGSLTGRPEPTKCPKCGYRNGGRFWICPCCKSDLRRADAAVLLASLAAPLVVLAFGG